jgi:hypothetical protein
MIYVLSNDFEVAKCKKSILRYIEKGAKVEVTEVKKRSLDQNGLFHVLIKLWAVETGEPDFEEAKEIIKKQFGAKYERSGLPKPSSSYTVEEMRMTIDRIYNWASLNGYDFPTTEEAPEAIDYIERNRF